MLRPSRDLGPLYATFGLKTRSEPLIFTAATIFASKPWAMAVIGGAVPT